MRRHPRAPPKAAPPVKIHDPSPAPPSVQITQPFATSSPVAVPKKPKKIVRPPKYHETATFLAREAFPQVLKSSESSTGGSILVGEAYRIATTVRQAVDRAARKVRPVVWGYGSIDGALGHNHTRTAVELAPVAFFRRENVRAVAAGNRLSLFLTGAAQTSWLQLWIAPVLSSADVVLQMTARCSRLADYSRHKTGAPCGVRARLVALSTEPMMASLPWLRGIWQRTRSMVRSICR